MTLEKTALEIVWLPKMHACIVIHVSPLETKQWKWFVYSRTIIKNAQNISENTEDILGCKEAKLQKYVIVCLSQCRQKSVVTVDFSTQSL